MPRPLAAEPPKGIDALQLPNIVVIVADDLGYGDLSCMGSEFRTPHLDRLAASGVRFSSWYSNAPLCSPSRASLLTGRYPRGTGVTALSSGRGGSANGLRAHVPTLPRALSEQLGYRTGMVGKWHLGGTPEGFPDRHGFEQWFGVVSGCVDYYSHIFYWSTERDPVHDLWDNGKEVFRNGEYATELFTDRAVEMMRDWVYDDDQQPFFLYLAYTTPHYPLHAPRKYFDRFPDLPPDRRAMAAMVSSLDDGVGAVMAELDRLGITDNTCVFVMSDNGPSAETRNWLDGREDPYYGGSAGALRGHKFSLYDGGTRVPALLSWPNRIDGGRVIDAPLAAMDIFPTLLTAAGGDPTPYKPDGADIWDVVTGTIEHLNRPIFWEHAGNAAVRDGDWKLVNEGGETFLSDIAKDTSERVNALADQPEIAAALRRLLTDWQQKTPVVLR